MTLLFSGRVRIMLTLLVVGYGVLIWLPLLTLSQFASDFELFLGRFHPSLVHFPIGILLAAVGMELLRRRGLPQLLLAVDLLLYAGAWAAILASASGLLLSGGGGYPAGTLFWHRTIGIGIATVAVLGWWLYARGDESPLPKKLLPGIFGLMVAGVVVGGHFGGDLTHHEGYLTRYLPDPVRKAVGLPDGSEVGKLIVEDPSTTTVYEAVVRPILDNRCLACHNDETTRGSLSLSSYDSMLKGGSDGAALTAGAANESLLIQRIWLPPEDEDHMPPRDRPQITVAEAELLRWWIDNGASTDETIEAMEIPEELRAIFDAYGLGDRKTGIFALDLPMPDTAAIATARATGLQVSFLALDVPYLEVRCETASACLGPAQVDALEPLTDYVAYFDARENNLSAEALNVISRFAHLIHARLEKTDLTDGGLEHLQNLEFLEVLNIYGNPVTDAGLDHLAALPSLQRVYAWQTGITPEGAALLVESGRRAEVDLGIPDR